MTKSEPTMPPSPHLPRPRQRTRLLKVSTQHAFRPRLRRRAQCRRATTRRKLQHDLGQTRGARQRSQEGLVQLHATQSARTSRVYTGRRRRGARAHPNHCGGRGLVRQRRHQVPTVHQRCIEAARPLQHARLFAQPARGARAHRGDAQAAPRQAAHRGRGGDLVVPAQVRQRRHRARADRQGAAPAPDGEPRGAGQTAHCCTARLGFGIARRSGRQSPAERHREPRAGQKVHAQGDKNGIITWAHRPPSYLARTAVWLPADEFAPGELVVAPTAQHAVQEVPASARRGSAWGSSAVSYSPRIRVLAGLPSVQEERRLKYPPTRKFRPRDMQTKHASRMMSASDPAVWEGRTDAAPAGLRESRRSHRRRASPSGCRRGWRHARRSCSRRGRLHRRRTTQGRSQRAHLHSARFMQTAVQFRFRR